MDNKTYTIITLSAVLLVSLGFNVMPEPTHRCDSRELKAYCFDLSSTGKTCYTLPEKIGGKRCIEGWNEIELLKPTNDYQISNAKQWECNQKECIPLN